MRGLYVSGILLMATRYAVAGYQLHYVPFCGAYFVNMIVSGQVITCPLRDW